ncbi:MAG: tRNA (guanosine(46)-N7)-methyltransferase TrmB [Flavobacteriales bacterium TMED113]|nr:MAG: tRNA (guanosine(46)-N7)-methyltransferase TrmB [Flavobacteriales bacterium TMED113]
MSKNKLTKFNELNSLTNTFQPNQKELLNDSFFLKGKWSQEFKNSNPIVLELGCGKGEYTVNLAKSNPNINYIGVDIKGARIWKGATLAQKSDLRNVRFLRTQIEQIDKFYCADEVSEIWITFPDPQIKYRRRKKRLTSELMLQSYKKILKKNGLVHLKTDSEFLHGYTLGILEKLNVEIIKSTHDLYKSNTIDKSMEIKTFYESMFLKKKKPITYICFKFI